MKMEWRISLFAGLAERLNTRQIILENEAEELPVRELKKQIADRYPGQADLITVSFIACNRAFAADSALVRREDELALLPPVSGGLDEASEVRTAPGKERFAIRTSPLRPEEALALVAHPDHGAALAFVGSTREWTGGQRTVTLEYEAYEPMALAAMQSIGEEISQRWPGTLCAIHHRIGTVGIGETSVVIAVSSPHRADCYEASRYAIERLKQTVPIWKKEVYEDGSEWKGHQLGPWNPLAALAVEKEGGR